MKVLDDRTAKIIMMIKQPQNFGNFSSHREAIRAFLCDYLNCPFEYCSDCIINDNIGLALLDYIDCCGKPSSFIRVLMHKNPELQCAHINVSANVWYDRIMEAFYEVQVVEYLPKSDTRVYINGFTLENAQPPFPSKQ